MRVLNYKSWLFGLIIKRTAFLWILFMFRWYFDSSYSLSNLAFNLKIILLLLFRFIINNFLRDLYFFLSFLLLYFFLSFLLLYFLLFSYLHFLIFISFLWSYLIFYLFLFILIFLFVFFLLFIGVKLIIFMLRKKISIKWFSKFCKWLSFINILWIPIRQQLIYSLSRLWYIFKLPFAI